MGTNIITFKEQVMGMTNVLTNNAEKRKFVRQGFFSEYNASHRLILPSSPEDRLKYKHYLKCWSDKPSSTTQIYYFTSDYLKCAEHILASHEHPITLIHDNKSFTVEIYFNKTQLNLNSMKRILKKLPKTKKKTKKIKIEFDWTKQVTPLTCVSIKKKETPYNIFGIMRYEKVYSMCIRSDIIKPPNRFLDKSAKHTEHTEQLIKSFSKNFDIVAPVIESAINRSNSSKHFSCSNSSKHFSCSNSSKHFVQLI